MVASTVLDFIVLLVMLVSFALLLYKYRLEIFVYQTSRYRLENELIEYTILIVRFTILSLRFLSYVARYLLSLRQSVEFANIDLDKTLHGAHHLGEAANSSLEDEEDFDRLLIY